MWRHEGTLLRRDGGDRYMFAEDGLVITRVRTDDGGKYYCVAANNAGSDKKITQLVVNGSLLFVPSTYEPFYVCSR